MSSILRLATFVLLAMSMSVSAYDIPMNETEAYHYYMHMKTTELLEKYRDQVFDSEFDHRKLDTTFTIAPTRRPSKRPTGKPTRRPTSPTKRPTKRPTSPTKLPTKRPTSPTKRPTRRPTRNPTKRPTGPTKRPTRRPTSRPTEDPNKIPDVCGTIQKTDGSDLILGTYSKPSWLRDKKYFDCNNDHTGDWWHRGMYAPAYMYNFRVSKTCKYLYRAPENDFSWEETRDVNSWLKQMVILNTRPGSKAYRVSDEDIIFKGYDDFPNKNAVLHYEYIQNCPEEYCVKIFGDFLTRESSITDSPTTAPTFSDKEVSYKGNDGKPAGVFPLGRCEGDCDKSSDCQQGLVCHQRDRGEPFPPGCSGGNKNSFVDYCAPPADPSQGPEIIWAFSDKDQHWDFYYNLKNLFDSKYKERIFGTNHFLRCGCESFCMDHSRKLGNADSSATCYVEEKCGTRVFMIQYPDFYIGTKATWADKGTTRVMDWFSECAKAMYGCTEFTDFDTDNFEIPPDGYYKHYNPFPRVWKHDSKDITDYTLPWFNITGNDGQPAEAFPLGLCQGDCDSDSDCAEGLQCFERKNNEPVPGCYRGAVKGWDYCYDPNHGNANPLPIAEYVGNNWKPAEAFPLAECQGDCDSDKDCEDGLVCHQRNRGQPIPGCAGNKNTGDDYCVKKEHRDAFLATGETGWVDEIPPESVTVDWTYGLGGDDHDGFRFNTMYKDGPFIEWTCPSREHRDELSLFGEYIANAELFRYASLDQEVPSTPCPDEEFLEPEYPPEDDPLLDCENISPRPVYCYHDTHATCYAQKTEADCDNIIFTVYNATGTHVFDDVATWHDACLENLDCHRVPEYAHIDGYLTKVGMPIAKPNFNQDMGWELLLMNKKYNGQQAIQGNKKVIWYNCSNWLQTFKSSNFTYGAGAYDEVYGNIKNTYGDLYQTKECTARPSSSPSLVPTDSLSPTNAPSQSPTYCSESYLTSEDLNIALVVDLSYSTYETEFSAVNPVGDVNGDGKGNTILDAQVVAIEELLGSIAKSDQLNNDNCEINLISFSTDAKSHGTWKPLADSNDAPNNELMDYIKQNLRAPTSNGEVQNTNNGFTNFDAALDVTVDYFKHTATSGRKDLLVFLSDGVPNVRGDGDDEGYCSDTVTFWKNGKTYQCSDLNIAPGTPHNFCKSNDANCANKNVYQDCVRGPNECTNTNAVTQYDSEIAELTSLGVERLAIGVGEASDVSKDSALWMIDNNPGKNSGVLPLQALNLDELAEYLGSLCILNTDPPTKSPSAAPSATPTVSMVPSAVPSAVVSDTPSAGPSSGPSSSPTVSPTEKPSSNPSNIPTTANPSADWEKHGEDDDVYDDDREIPVPEPTPCPEDIELVHQSGETSFPLDSVRIVSQDTTSVTVQIHQTFTGESSPLDGLYYQYQYNLYSERCYEKTDLEYGHAVELTMNCMVGNHVAILEFWAADDARKGFLNATDGTEIPDCCYPTIPPDTPAIRYVVAVRCVTACPEISSSESKSGTFSCNTDTRCMEEEEHDQTFLRRRTK